MYDDLSSRGSKSQSDFSARNWSREELQAFIKERQVQLFTEIIGSLASNVSHGWERCFTFHDLAVSIINGASPELYTAFPAALKTLAEYDPASIPEDFPDRDPHTEVVTLKSNPIIFLHFLKLAQMSGTAPKNLDRETLNSQIYSLKPEATEEYYLMLQEASRFFAKSPQISNTLCSEFLSLWYAREYLQGDLQFGLNKPVSVFLDDTAEGPRICHGQILLQQRLLPGSKVFIGGAGLNVLYNLRELSLLSNYHFEINDSDPFISSCLEKFFRLSPIPNVTFTSGRISEALKSRHDLDLILLPNLFRLNGDSQEDLVNLFISSCKPYSPVHIFQRNDPNRENCVDAVRWAKLMYEAQFSVHMNSDLALKAGALERYERKEILALGPLDIKSSLRLQEVEDLPRLVPHRLIISSTPLSH